MTRRTVIVPKDRMRCVAVDRPAGKPPSGRCIKDSTHPEREHRDVNGHRWGGMKK